MNQRFHLLSMSEPPKMDGVYTYALEDEPMAWSQEKSWLLLVVDHVGTFSVGARTFAYQPWTSFVVPPGTRCRLHKAEDRLCCAHWFRFIPAMEGAPMVALPVSKELGDYGPFWDNRFRSALNRSFQMQKETRAVLTDLLWSIAEDPGSVRLSPALEEAEKYIESNLSSTIRVEALAAHAGVSHNHLIRLFKEEHGVSPLEYIRHRRQHYACRMLLETQIPIKQIALTVGVPDLAQFSRLIHQAAGMSPRELRASTRPANLFRV